MSTASQFDDSTGMSNPARPTRRERLVDLAFLVALWGAIAWCCAPTLDHPFRSDQWNYFLDTLDAESFGETLAQSYSYNRTRHVAPGDESLFRPVLFGLLTVERWAFGYDARWWHVTGVALHALVVTLTFVLLRRMDRWHPAGGVTRAASHVLAGFFALNACLVEQIAWAHIAAYMLFLALVLGALILVVDALHEPNAWRLASAWTLSLVAAFTYEAGQVAALLLGGLVLASRLPRRRSIAWLCAFAVVPVLYQVANQVDYAVHSASTELNQQSSGILEHAFGLATLSNTGRFVRFTLLQPFAPWRLRIEAGSRFQILEPSGGLAGIGLPGALLLALVVGMLVAGARAALRRPKRDRTLALSFIAVLLGLWSLHAAMVVLGRMNLRPHPEVLTANSYYTYAPLCYAVLAIGWLLHLANHRPGRHVRTATLVLLVALGGSMLIHARQLRTANEELATTFADRIETERELRRWCAEHENEPGFDFAIDVPRSRGLNLAHGVPKLMVLLHPYVDQHDPRHVVVLRSGRVRRMSAEEYRVEYAAEPSFPAFVDVDEPYNVFEYDSRSIALSHDRGFLDPGRHTVGSLERAMWVQDGRGARALGIVRAERLEVPDWERTADLDPGSPRLSWSNGEVWERAEGHGFHGAWSVDGRTAGIRALRHEALLTGRLAPSPREVALVRREQVRVVAPSVTPAPRAGRPDPHSPDSP